MQPHHPGRHLAATLLGFAMLSLGCDDSTGPVTGAIQLTVSTAGEMIDRDHDGYTLSVDGGPNRNISVDEALTIANLSPGRHLLRLDGLAPNCSVGGTNPRTVEVVASRKAAAFVAVSLFVLCVPKTGTIHVSSVTSGSDPDLDGYSVSVTGVNRGTLPANGTVSVTGVREGPVEVGLTGVSGNCVVNGANPRTVLVAYGATVEVAFALQCVPAGRLRVTTATTGPYLDPTGYDLDLRFQEAGSSTHTAALTNGTVTVPGLLPGNYLLTVFDMAPNCDAVTANPRVVAVSAGSETSVTIDITCEAARQFAFVGGTGTNADIYVMASTGGAVSRITTQPGSDADPAWSPDGSRIAFASERDGNPEIYVMNASGQSLVRLTNVPAADFQPAWSPNAARIAFVSTRDLNAEIYVMNADGTSPVRLTSNVASDADPAWSPDGSRIAFSSDRDGSAGIWIMNADGSGLTRLTSNTWADRQPAWSPDGTRIAFSRGSSSSSDIFIVNIDGSGLRRLTQGIDQAADPAWSPDGRKIALGAMQTDCGWYDYYCDPYILIVSIDGIPYSSLTTPAEAYNPAWRP